MTTTSPRASLTAAINRSPASAKRRGPRPGDAGLLAGLVKRLGGSTEEIIEDSAATWRIAPVKNDKQNRVQLTRSLRPLDGRDAAPAEQIGLFASPEAARQALADLSDFENALPWRPAEQADKLHVNEALIAARGHQLDYLIAPGGGSWNLHAAPRLSQRQEIVRKPADPNLPHPRPTLIGRFDSMSAAKRAAGEAELRSRPRAPKVGDIVQVYFPDFERPNRPGLVSRPALVLWVKQEGDGAHNLQLAPALSPRHASQEGSRRSRLTLDKPAELAAAGLKEPTSFDLSRRAAVTWSTDYVDFTRDRPILGALDPMSFERAVTRYRQTLEAERLNERKKDSVHSSPQTTPADTIRGAEPRKLSNREREEIRALGGTSPTLEKRAEALARRRQARGSISRGLER